MKHFLDESAALAEFEPMRMAALNAGAFRDMPTMAPVLFLKVTVDVVARPETSPSLYYCLGEAVPVVF